MNEITKTKEQLTNEIEAIGLRDEKMHTDDGKAMLREQMTKIFEVMESFGYRTPKTDLSMMIDVWSFTMKQYYIDYGIGVIKQAFMNFVANDTNKYHNFPSVGQIVKEIDKIAVNPKVLLARMELEEKARKMKEEKQSEYARLSEERKKDIADRWSAIVRCP